MPFSDKAKMVALAIVYVFEASKPLGDYAALVVLDDGAGVSYGINQFTHRSGSLLAVVQKYLANGGTVGRTILTSSIDALRLTSKGSIDALGRDRLFQSALKKAAATPEMQAAQQAVMVEKYLTPAIEACEGSHFTLPLSLACVYDSINHGSFGLIRDQDTVDRSTFSSDIEFEKAWITEYARLRLKWIQSKRGSLRNTVYRPNFFLEQIDADNWDLDLPVIVHGVKLTDAMFNTSAAAPAVEPSESQQTNSNTPTSPQTPPEIEQPPTNEADEASSATPDDASAAQGQPSPTVWDHVNNFQDKAQRVTALQQTLSPISKSSRWAVFVTKVGGWATLAMGMAGDHPVWVIAGAVLVVAGLVYLAIAKGHALDRLKTLLHHGPAAEQSQTVVVKNSAGL